MFSRISSVIVVEDFDGDVLLDRRIASHETVAFENEEGDEIPDPGIKLPELQSIQFVEKQIGKNYNDFLIKGKFISEWEDGIQVKVKAELDPETGEIFVEPFEIDGLISPERQYFQDDEGNEYEICPECNSFIMKTVMVPSYSDPKTLVEETECSNPDCDNKA